MSIPTNDVRTSLRLSNARQRKLKLLKKVWSMPSLDETIGFILDAADPENLRTEANKHVARIKVAEAKEKQRKAQLDQIIQNLSPEQIEKLISGEASL